MRSLSLLLFVCGCATAPAAPDARGRHLVGNWVYGDPGSVCRLSPTRPDEPAEKREAKASEMLILGEGGAYLHHVKRTTREGDWRVVDVKDEVVVVVLRPDGSSMLGGLDTLLCGAEPPGEILKLQIVHEDRIDTADKTLRRCFLVAP